MPVCISDASGLLSLVSEVADTVLSEPVANVDPSSNVCNVEPSSNV